MPMRKVKLLELSEDVRGFLAQVQDGEGILIEDADGRACYGIIPYYEASLADQQAALDRLKKLQKKVGVMMKQTGKTEEELDQLLQDND